MRYTHHLPMNWEKLFADEVREKGAELFRNGAVTCVDWDRNLLEGEVREGDQCYDVEASLTAEDEAIGELHCSCPLGRRGEHCAHLAAALYAEEEKDRQESWEDWEIDDDDEDEGETTGDFQAPWTSEDREVLTLREGAPSEVSAEDFLDEEDLDDYREEVEQIFAEYQERCAGIPDRLPRAEREEYLGDAAEDFVHGLTQYLDLDVRDLAEEGDFAPAFVLSAEIFTRAGAELTDMWNRARIQYRCWDLWREILGGCPQELVEEIREWFGMHLQERTLSADDLRFLQMFRDQVLDRIDGPQVWMQRLDACIESATGSECPRLFSAGVPVPAIDLRTDLMRQLGMGEKEIALYRREHLRFAEVREEELKKAQEESEVLEQLGLLEQSIRDMNHGWRWRSAKSHELADLCRENGDPTRGMEVLVEDYFSIPSDQVEARRENIRQLRQICTDELWESARESILDGEENPILRCEILAQDGLTDLLQKELLPDGDFYLIQRFAPVLAKTCPDALLQAYEEYLRDLVPAARSRGAYEELCGCLRQMQTIPGGRERASALAARWIVDFPTRKVLVRRLEDFL